MDGCWRESGEGDWESMKILHICPDTAEASGIHTFCFQVNESLKDLGVDSRIATDKSMLIEGRWIPDIVHCHGIWMPIFHFASKWARRRGIPVVWSTHGTTAPWSMHHKWWKKIVAWWLYQKWDLRRAAVIHSTTELERGWNEKLGLVGKVKGAIERSEIAEGLREQWIRSVVVPLGTHLTEGVKGDVKGEGEQRNGKVLLFVGRVYPVKALDNLIAAFQAVDQEDWKLRIVGPDQAGHMEELKKVAGKDVEFVGPKFGEELSNEYEKCDCLALVSHTENFGATVIDAMAHGKPVITGMKTPWKVVADRRCGWWVSNEIKPLSEAIVEMMSLSDAERAEMGMRGRKLVEDKYTWEAIAKSIKEEYTKLLHNIGK